MNAHHKKRSYRPSPPKSTARYSSGSFEVKPDGKEEVKVNKVMKAAERVPFGWQLDVLVPAVGCSSSTQLATELETLMKGCGEFYLCEGVNLAALLEPDFLNSFVRKGSLVALSLDDSEGDDVVAIDGRGRLILSVCKDTYELLGLPGRASAYGSLRQRFIIEISLTDPSFRAGKPGFERTKRLLRDWPAQTDLFDALAGVGTTSGPSSPSVAQKGRTFDMVMCYTDEHGTPRPITFPSTVPSRRIESTFTSHTLSSIRVPLSSSFPSSTSASEARKRPRTSSGAFRKPVDESAVFWEEYREWAGLVQLGEEGKVRWVEGQEEEEEEWGLPLERCEKGEVSVLSWTGMLHPKAMGRVLDSLTSSEAFRQSPFLSLVLRPFPHSPISHLSAASPPVVGTSKLPNGKKRKRGRGRGEEEEAERGRMEEAGGWEAVVKPAEGGKVEWHLWEGQ